MTEPVPAPAWLDELSLPVDGPPWLSMGTGRITDDRWLLPDELRAEELAERHDLLAHRHAEVFGALAGTEAAGEEALHLVLAWERDHRPALTDERVADGVHPLEAAGRRTQEDLVLMVPRDGGHHLDAAILCFPSHWRLADKLGGSAAEIHGPVPGYDVDLEAKVDRFLARLRDGVIVARRNHSIHESPERFSPVRPPSQPFTEQEVADGLWLRSERQTLRLLPQTGAVLFTIRVQQTPFRTFADAPEVAARFADRLRAQPDAVTEMNGLATNRDAVIAYLRSVADPPTS